MTHLSDRVIKGPEYLVGPKDNEIMSWQKKKELDCLKGWTQITYELKADWLGVSIAEPCPKGMAAFPGELTGSELKPEINDFDVADLFMTMPL